ncbi:MAG: hypothetical protein AB7P03_28010 [Kofleriaceae bacterium]
MSARLAAACAAALGCGSSGGSTIDAPRLVGGPDEHHPDRVGYIELIEGFSGVYALIHDRPEQPPPLLTAREGDCAIYLRAQIPLCDPPCTGTTACTAPSTCTPWPQNASAGAIEVTGLREPLTFTTGQFGYVPEPAPPLDLFDAGAAIHIEAAGDVTPSFVADLTGVARLTGSTQNLTLDDEEDARIEWTAAGDARIAIALVTGWHGAPYEAMLRCETDDDGELMIPRSLIADFPRQPEGGLEQHPSWMMRFDRAIVMVPAGAIEVVVGSQANLYFTHP